MDQQITVDPAYNTVAPDDFRSMIEVERYGQRSDAFDGIISQTHDHFWDPMDPAYIDFTTPFDMEGDYLMPPERVQELNSAVSDRLDEKGRVKLVNELQRWQLSNILHGEQGALSLSANLCQILKDGGAQEYAANQAREEARHVTGFARYIEARWDGPALPGLRAARQPAGRPGPHPDRLQETGRHADAAGGPRHGRLRQPAQGTPATRC